MRILVMLLIVVLAGSPAMAKSKSKPKAKAKAKSARHAKAPKKFTGKLLTYKQLMTLPKAKRMAYIKGLTEVLILMEGFNSKMVTADNSGMREMREQIAGFLKLIRLFPEAQAQAAPAAAAIDLSKIVPIYNAATNQWSCPAGAAFDYSFRACLLTDQYGLTFYETPCPAGSKQMSHYLPNTFACIPNANWSLIPPVRQQGIQTSVFAAPSTLRNEKPERQAGLVLGSAAAAHNPVVAGGTADQPAVPTEVQTVTVEPPATDVDQTLTEPGVVADPATVPDTAAAAPAEACVPPVQACKQLSDGDRETAITRFRGTAAYEGVDANVCVSGGFLSSYHGARKTPTNCKVPRGLTFSNGMKTPECKKDEALCNPVLFCLGARPKGSDKFQPITFCVKKTGDKKNPAVTKACATDYANMLAGKQKKENGKLLPLIAGAPDLKPEICDPKNLPNEIPIKAEWDAMIASTEKLRDVWCGKSDFSALFCDECEIINDKIFTLNKNATGSGCAEVVVAGTDGAAVPDAGPAGGRAIREGDNTEGPQ